MKKRLLQIHYLLMISVLCVGCQTAVKTISSRNPNTISKAGDTYVHERLKNESQKPDLYVKTKTTNITPVDDQNSTGSLIKLDDTRNYLFISKTPYVVGQFINVNVASTRGGEGTEKSTQTDNKEKQAADESSGDASVAEMLKALPELEPADKSISLVKQIKMKITHIFENGDVLLALKRTSVSEFESKDIDIQTRVPYLTLVSKDNISTSDMLDVHWIESTDGTINERFSSGWEDEYTLRLSGFNEAKSKMALELDDKRRNLEDVKERLRNQMISVGKERKQMAGEREKLLKERAAEQQKMQEIQAKMDEQATQLAAFEKEANATAEADQTTQDNPNDKKTVTPKTTTPPQPTTKK